MASARVDLTLKINTECVQIVGEADPQQGEGKDGAFSASSSAAPQLLPIAGHWFEL